MGFYFRKTASLGPFRLNFSKSGIGVSAGIKGARISTGPRGTYIHAGRNGFHYRQRLGQTRTRNSGHRQDQAIPTESRHSSSYVIETADISQLTDSSITELLNEINEKTARMRVAPFAVAASILAVIIIWLAVSALIGSVFEPSDAQSTGMVILIAMLLSAGVGIGGSVLSWKIHKGDELARTTPLFYELEAEPLAKFSNVQSACHALSQACRSWRVHTNQPTWDWKRNAGASTLISRLPISVRVQAPPYIATNVEVWSISLNDLTLFFLPDYVFVRQQGKYGAVSYDSLKVSYSPTRYIEEQGVPPDAQVLDYTWRYVNKKGGPDRRFSNNYQLPIVQYAFLQLDSTTGLNIHLNVSNLNAATVFAEAFKIRSSRRTRRTDQEQTRRESTRRPVYEHPYIDPRIRLAYETLGVSVSASEQEIVSAYRSMAKMYHPDRLANLAPEFVELAEERMKEINVAYETLKRR